MKTKSLWGNPPSRYYAFLRRVELGFDLKKSRMDLTMCLNNTATVIPWGGFLFITSDFELKNTI